MPKKSFKKPSSIDQKDTRLSKTILKKVMRTGRTPVKVKNTAKKRTKPVITKYVKQKCAFVDANGKECRFYAVGKSTLCKKHGGVSLIPENLVPDEFITNRSIFNPSFHPMEYLKLSKIGKTLPEIAANFEVSVFTLKKWSEKFETFQLVFDAGLAMQEAWWLVEGKDNLKNPKYNTHLFKFLTGNTIGYSDKIESKSTNHNIHGVLLVPASPTSDADWEDIAEAELANMEDEV